LKKIKRDSESSGERNWSKDSVVKKIWKPKKVIVL